MDRTIVEKPPGLTIVANNWLHEGWLFGALGLPERPFNTGPDVVVSDADIELWRDGYRMAMKSGVIPPGAIRMLVTLGQLKITPARI